MKTLLDNTWIEITKFDPRAVGLYQRHYSARKGVSPTIRRQRGILSPGESMTLLTNDGRALFAWRKGIDDCIPPQTGVNCAVFRNEGELLSSDLIKEADELAWQKWSDKRHYTYVNAGKIKSRHPGYCFIQAGWDYQRDEQNKPVLTKGGLYIWQVFPHSTYSLNWLLPFSIGSITLWYPPLLMALIFLFFAGYIAYKHLLPKRFSKYIQDRLPPITKGFLNYRRNSVPHTKPIQKEIDDNDYKAKKQERP